LRIRELNNILKDALELAFKKFWYYGRVRITIQRKDWGKGSLGHSAYCEPIRIAMLREKLIDEIHISGVTEGGYSFNKDSLADLQRFMDNKQMTGKIKKVFNNLMKQIKLKIDD
jgi:hypothetical protein